MKTRFLGRVAYEPTWRAMQAFTASRQAATPDELWLLEHPPVFTLGLAGRAEHVHAPGSIPLVRTDRGGQVTYHGPGQAVAYVLCDLRRTGMGVKALVNHLEQAAIDVLRDCGIRGEREPGRPGVYVDGAKIAAVGLRVTRGCSYHGLALNVGVDLEPFTRIDPCGYRGLRSTRLADLGVRASIEEIQRHLAHHLARGLNADVRSRSQAPAEATAQD